MGLALSLCGLAVAAGWVALYLAALGLTFMVSVDHWAAPPVPWPFNGLLPNLIAFVAAIMFLVITLTRSWVLLQRPES